MGAIESSEIVIILSAIGGAGFGAAAVMALVNWRDGQGLWPPVFGTIFCGIAGICLAFAAVST